MHLVQFHYYRIFLVTRVVAHGTLVEAAIDRLPTNTHQLDFCGVWACTDPHNRATAQGNNNFILHSPKFIIGNCIAGLSRRTRF
jgi:hypothetical protein